MKVFESGVPKFSVDFSLPVSMSPQSGKDTCDVSQKFLPSLPNLKVLGDTDIWRLIPRVAIALSGVCKYS